MPTRSSPRPSRAVPPVAVCAVLTALTALTACGGGGSPNAAPRPARVRVPASTAPVPASTAPVTTAAPASTAPTSVTRASSPGATTPPRATSPPPTTAAPSLADRLIGAGDAGQVLAVVADGYGATTATLTAYQRSGSGWTQVFGPWTAFVGSSGFAPPGAKHEGDGRTPTGAYGFDFAFGVQPDPGTHLPYRVVTSSAIVWDDDPASSLYNEWVDTAGANAGANPEPMDKEPAYDYGAVIAYNDARTPGLGSAIFLHVTTGRPTAGCVSLPADELLAVLRWLDPARSPRIVMGVAAAVLGPQT